MILSSLKRQRTKDMMVQLKACTPLHFLGLECFTTTCTPCTPRIRVIIIEAEYSVVPSRNAQKRLHRTDRGTKQAAVCVMDDIGNISTVNPSFTGPSKE